MNKLNSLAGAIPQDLYELADNSLELHFVIDYSADLELVCSHSSLAPWHSKMRTKHKHRCCVSI